MRHCHLPYDKFLLNSFCKFETDWIAFTWIKAPPLSVLKSAYFKACGVPRRPSYGVYIYLKLFALPEHLRMLLTSIIVTHF